MKRIHYLLIIGLIALLSIGAACGDGDDDDNGDNDITPTEVENGEPAGQPGPDDPTVSISSAEADVGGSVDAEVTIVYDLEPGIAAWTFDIVYDPDILTAVECDAIIETGVCNTEYASNVVRVVGAHLGLDPGENIMGRITFQCDAAGESELEVAVETLADGTIGDPQELLAHIEDGAITCG